MAINGRQQSKVLPIEESISVREQFGFLPLSIIKPTKESKIRWKEAYFDDGEIEIRKDSAGYNSDGTIGFQKMSEFHAGLAENLIRYWSLKGARVVDPFAGRVTRAVVTTKLDREYYGYEITPNTYKRALTHFDKHNINPTLYNGDGCKLEYTEDNFADLVMTCPPYFNIEQYESCDGQLSDIKGYDNFLLAMNECVKNVERILKPGGFAVFVVADFRVGGELKSFSSDLINQFKNNDMIHWDTIIMENISPYANFTTYQAACKRYTPKTHEYILVFRKKGEYEVPEYCSVDIPQQTQKLNQFFI
jgi:DNA modification methylase